MSLQSLVVDLKDVVYGEHLAGHSSKRVRVGISEYSIELVYCEDGDEELAIVRLEAIDGRLQVIIWNKDVVREDQEPDIIQLA